MKLIVEIRDGKRGPVFKSFQFHLDWTNDNYPEDLLFEEDLEVYRFEGPQRERPEKLNWELSRDIISDIHDGRFMGYHDILEHSTIFADKLVYEGTVVWKLLPESEPERAWLEEFRSAQSLDPMADDVPEIPEKQKQKKGSKQKKASAKKNTRQGNPAKIGGWSRARHSMSDVVGEDYRGRERIKPMTSYERWKRGVHVLELEVPDFMNQKTQIRLRPIGSGADNLILSSRSFIDDRLRGQAIGAANRILEMSPSEQDELIAGNLDLDAAQRAISAWSTKRNLETTDAELLRKGRELISTYPSSWRGASRKSKSPKARKR